MTRNRFGSIRQLPSGRWQVRYVTQPGIEVTAKTLEGRSLTFASEKHARTYLLHLESDMAKGVNPYELTKQRGTTLRARVDLYLDPTAGARLSAEPLRASTLANYRRLADAYLLPSYDEFTLADREIHTITPSDVRRWYGLAKGQCVPRVREIKTRAHPARIWAQLQGIPVPTHGLLHDSIKQAWLQAGAPITTTWRDIPDGSVQVAQAYRLLRAVFNVALEDELITTNPCRIKGAGQAHHPERPTATPEQVSDLAHEVPERYRMAVLVAAFSSLRASELFALQRKHLNQVHSSITVEHQLTRYSRDPSLFVPPKTRASLRTVVIPRNLMTELMHHLEKFCDDHPDALIFTTSNGNPLYKGRMSWWQTAKRRIDLQHLHFHDLRHTGQTLAMQQGASVKDLQRRAGQSSERAASIYLHGSRTRDAQVAQSLTDYVAISLRRRTAS